MTKTPAYYKKGTVLLMLLCFFPRLFLVLDPFSAVHLFQRDYFDCNETQAASIPADDATGGGQQGWKVQPAEPIRAATRRAKHSTPWQAFCKLRKRQTMCEVRATRYPLAFQHCVCVCTQALLQRLDAF